MIFLTTAELLHVAARAIGTEPQVIDVGLLAAAAARPRASVLGQDAYPTLIDKSAALVHSLTRNHALVDGNKRLALAGTITFLGVNGHELTFSNDEAYDFILRIATGQLDDVPAIAGALTPSVRQR